MSCAFWYDPLTAHHFFGIFAKANKCNLNSNYEEASGKLKLSNILQNNWSVFFKEIMKLIEGKD